MKIKYWQHIKATVSPGGALNFFLVDVCHAGFKMKGLGSVFFLKNGGLENKIWKNLGLDS